MTTFIQNFGKADTTQAGVIWPGVQADTMGLSASKQEPILCLTDSSGIQEERPSYSEHNLRHDRR